MPRLAQLVNLPRSVPVPGYKHFLTPLRRLVFDYDMDAPHQAGVR